MGKIHVVFPVRTLRNPSEGGHLGKLSDSEIRSNPRWLSCSWDCESEKKVVNRTGIYQNRIFRSKDLGGIYIDDISPSSQPPNLGPIICMDAHVAPINK